MTGVNMISLTKEQIHSQIKERKMPAIDDVESTLNSLLADQFPEILDTKPNTELRDSKNSLCRCNKLGSNVSDQSMPPINEWQSRPLKSAYAVLFLDAFHCKIKRNGHIINKVAYITLGIDYTGNKDVLGVYIRDLEASKFWSALLSDLKNRGVEDLLICCVDNHTSFSEAANIYFPKAVIQKCIMHQMRNCLCYVAFEDAKNLLQSLGPIHAAKSENTALEALERFDKIWGAKYPLAVQSWRRNWSKVATCFNFTPEIRKLICTTSILEKYHRLIRKATNEIAYFPDAESFIKMLYLFIQDEMNRGPSKIDSSKQILLQISVFFSDRVKLHIV